MNKKEALRLVAKYILDQGGEVNGMTPKKIFERAELIDDSKRPDWIVFEVERHRGILGTRYISGVPMEAFVTYWERYAFHPRANTLEYLGERRESDVYINYHTVASHWFQGWDLLSFSFEPVEGGKYRCMEGVSGEERLVSDVSEVETWAVEIVNSWPLDSEADVLREFLEAEEVWEHVNRLREALEEEARERSIQAWEERDWEKDW